MLQVLKLVLARQLSILTTNGEEIPILEIANDDLYKIECLRNINTYLMWANFFLAKVLEKTTTNSPSEFLMSSINTDTTNNIVITKSSSTTINDTNDFQLSQLHNNQLAQIQKHQHYINEENNLDGPTNFNFFKSNNVVSNNMATCSYLTDNKNKHIEYYLKSQEENENMGYKNVLENKQEKYICKACNISFKSLEKLTGHLRYSQKCQDRSVRKIECTQCSKSFNAKANLKRHIARVHLKNFKNVCTTCGKKCQDSFSLSTHITSHSNEAKFECNICGNFLKTKSSLNTHLWRHRDPKPFGCVYCDNTFVSHNALNNHLISIHGVSHFNKNDGEVYEDVYDYNTENMD